MNLAKKEVELYLLLEASWNSIHFEWKWRRAKSCQITLNLLGILAWSLCPLMLDSLRCLWYHHDAICYHPQKPDWSNTQRIGLIPSNPRISQNRMMFTWPSWEISESFVDFWMLDDALMHGNWNETISWYLKYLHVCENVSSFKL